MATQDHSTRTPLLPLSRNAPPLLGQGLGRQPGPVTQAIRAMREAEPGERAVAAIQDGLAAHFAAADRQRVRELRRRIADRIEADLALLDALDPDPEAEDGADIEGLTDDNGIADYDAIGEQGFSGYGGCL